MPNRWFHPQTSGPTVRYACGSCLILLWAALLPTTQPAFGSPAAAFHDGEGEPAVSAGAKDSAVAAVDAQTSAGVPDGQTPSPGTADQKSGQSPDTGVKKSDPPASDKKGSWLFAPIPINSPAIGAGLQWAAARLFPLNKRDEISPPSTVGIGGVFTNNGSRAIAIGARLYVKEDRYRFATALGTADVNLDIYGVGKVSGDNGTFVPLKTKGKGFLGEALYGVRKGLYIGLRGQYRNFRLSLNPEKLESSDITHEPPEEVAGVIEQIRDQLFQQQTVSIGPRFQWDSRDNVFYPKRGVFMDVNMDLFSTGLGSKWSYQYYKVGFNKYVQIAKTQVLAFRGMACAATGDRVPIYDLCLFGSMNDIRGYTAGRYQDRRMFATQAEYRLMLPLNGFLGRFGVAAFGGFGAVGAKFTDIRSGDLLPGGGAGARFRLLKKEPINFRVDYGMGKVGHTLTIGIMEAF